MNTTVLNPRHARFAKADNICAIELYSGTMLVNQVILDTTGTYIGPNFRTVPAIPEQLATIYFPVLSFYDHGNICITWSNAHTVCGKLNEYHPLSYVNSSFIRPTPFEAPKLYSWFLLLQIVMEACGHVQVQQNEVWTHNVFLWVTPPITCQQLIAVYVGNGDAAIMSILPDYGNRWVKRQAFHTWWQWCISMTTLFVYTITLPVLINLGLFQNVSTCKYCPGQDINKIFDYLIYMYTVVSRVSKGAGSILEVVRLKFWREILIFNYIHSGYHDAISLMQCACTYMIIALWVWWIPCTQIVLEQVSL